MTRHLVLGNGNMLVCTDKNALIRDFYYPHVGQENHVSGNIHRIGIWIDGAFSWLNNKDWNMDISYEKESLVGNVFASNEQLGVEIRMRECVHFENNIYLRKFSVKNNFDRDREIRIFFSQHFHISEDNIGDSIYFDPRINSIINYKGKRYFLTGGVYNGKDFDQYAVGVSGGVQNKMGTWKDCEDGWLEGNSVEHGSTDSAIGFNLHVKAMAEESVDYWICVGKNYEEVDFLRQFILDNGFDNLINSTDNHWKKWVNKEGINFYELGENLVDLFKRSLLVIRVQTDNHGATIAANDTHTLRFKRDTYSYMWPRDGALISRSLDHAGHSDLTKKFFRFCSEGISRDGYLLHKYNPDGSPGSTWHSHLKGNKLQLPIQEDETALVMDALWKHYAKYGDEDKMIKKHYRKFIKKMGDFMLDFRDKETGLPKESYDLWEEKLGIHTFTCSATYAGLMAASKFADIFGAKKDVEKYKEAAGEVREATLKHLFNEELGIFVKRIYFDNDGGVHMDNTVDASTFYGLFEFNLLELDDERFVKTLRVTLEKLWSENGILGLSRYEGDLYHRADGRENPWVVCTMWLAEYYIAVAKNLEDLEHARKLFDWVSHRALRSGVLAEQFNPNNGEALSVAPLTWSHAAYVVALLKYLRRFGELRG